MTESTNNRPADTVRISNLEAAIWRRESSNGSWYSFTLNRSYKDGENWQRSDSFGKDDALLLAKVIDRTHDRMLELEAADRKAARESRA